MKLYVFACDDRCARKVFNDNQPDTFPDGFVVVRRANDLAGVELETIEVAKCEHRWSAGTRTAWKHFEWVIFEYAEPVDEVYARGGYTDGSVGFKPTQGCATRRLARDKNKDS